MIKPKKHSKLQNCIITFYRYVFHNKTRLGWRNYVLGPNKSHSSSKIIHMFLFPGLNLPIQVKISGNISVSLFFVVLVCSWGYRKMREFIRCLFFLLFFFGLSDVFHCFFFTREGFLQILCKHHWNPPKSFPCEFSLLGPPKGGACYFFCPPLPIKNWQARVVADDQDKRAPPA